MALQSVTVHGIQQETHACAAAPPGVLGSQGCCANIDQTEWPRDCWGLYQVTFKDPPNPNYSIIKRHRYYCGYIGLQAETP